MLKNKSKSFSIGLPSALLPADRQEKEAYLGG